MGERFFGEHPLVVVRFGKLRLGTVVDRDRRLSAFEELERFVLGYLHQPAVERGVVLQRRDLLKYADKRLLDGVLRVGAVLQNAVCQRVNPLIVQLV